jgi:uncharacterized protein GlcG (DUF336 family)
MKNSAKGVPAVALKVLMAVGIALLLCGSANAQGAGNTQGPANVQGLVTQRNLSLAMAKTVAEAALAACQAKGYHTAVAVVDRAGQVLVILRDEQATAQHAEMARRKAYTARMFRITTTEFQKRTADPPYAAQRDLPDILALGGGAPIQVGNETVGGVGSAGSTLEQDDACAKAGIAKVTDLLQ